MTTTTRTDYENLSITTLMNIRHGVGTPIARRRAVDAEMRRRGFRTIGQA
jgi:hypothetical protein